MTPARTASAEFALTTPSGEPLAHHEAIAGEGRKHHGWEGKAQPPEPEPVTSLLRCGTRLPPPERRKEKGHDEKKDRRGPRQEPPPERRDRLRGGSGGVKCGQAFDAGGEER